jgi:hypothetical protein
MDALLARLMTPALVSLLVAAVALVLFDDWRLRLVALAVQYTAAAILVTQGASLEVALVRLVVGYLVVAILVLTAAQFRPGRSSAPPVAAPGTPEARHEEVVTGFSFRLIATAMFGIAALYLSGQPNMALPGVAAAPALNIGSYVLLAFGLLSLGLSEEPLRAGTGLLTLLTGFELFYVVVEPSLAVVALLAAAEFGVALAVSYLTVLQASADGAPGQA